MSYSQKSIIQELYRKQSKDHTCGVASAAMALDYLCCIKCEEEKLEDILNTSEATGTDRVSFEKLGDYFPVTVETGTEATIDMLLENSASGGIVLVNYLGLFDDELEGHWAIFLNADSENVTLCDPWFGPAFSMCRSTFLLRWKSGFANELRPFVIISKF